MEIKKKKKNFQTSDNEVLTPKQEISLLQNNGVYRQALLRQQISLNETIKEISDVLKKMLEIQEVKGTKDEKYLNKKEYPDEEDKEEDEDDEDDEDEDEEDD